MERFRSSNGARALVSDITWKGCQWTYESLGKTVTGVREDWFTVVTKSDRIANINLPDSQAYMVNFFD